MSNKQPWMPSSWSTRRCRQRRLLRPKWLGSNLPCSKHKKAQDLSAEATEAVVATAEPPPGFISIAFAEEKWAERESVLAQQLAQLQTLVAAQADAPSVPEQAHSEAGETIASDLLDDDDAWCKVDRGRRKAVLRRERDALANKV